MLSHSDVFRNQDQNQQKRIDVRFIHDILLITLSKAHDMHFMQETNTEAFQIRKKSSLGTNSGNFNDVDETCEYSRSKLQNHSTFTQPQTRLS